MSKSHLLTFWSCLTLNYFEMLIAHCLFSEEIIYFYLMFIILTQFHFTTLLALGLLCIKFYNLGETGPFVGAFYR